MTFSVRSDHAVLDNVQHPNKVKISSTMGFINMKDETGSPTIGGYNIPDPTKLFRHHPARPPPGTPPTGPSAPVGPLPLSGYLKYFTAGALCATVTHVPQSPLGVDK